MAERYFVVHGHFYQPPRSNPYLGMILRQESAWPFHDWNEKIFTECYQPNTGSRIVNENGFTTDSVNNFEYISFNIGPTLAEWMRFHHPFTFSQIVEADRKKGGAIACAYSHTILPLASDFMRKLDVEWGLRDFERNFGRKADALWLPETAVNEIVLEELAARGLKFLILVPTQIQSAKPLGVKKELDVSSGNIDPRYCYKAVTPSGEIKVFIAHGAISQAVSFEYLMSDARHAADIIEAAFSPKTHHDQVVSAVCDGETFGHHQPFAERGLSYLLKYELPKRGIKVVNFNWLANNMEASWELKIKNGGANRGTSWSCAHGLERWRSDCGCGKIGNTTQAWRGPLREAFNFIESKTVNFFLQNLKNILKEESIWEYPFAIGDFSKNEEFLKKGELHELDFREKKFALSLFEMLRFTLFSFTSCGWFWESLERLEGVQNMVFAKRACELYKKLSGEDITEKFLEILSKAPANDKRFRNGRDVFEAFVKPQENSIFIYVAGEILKALTINSSQPITKEESFFRLFIDPFNKTANFVDKQTEEKIDFEYELIKEDFPPEIILKGKSFNEKYSCDEIFGEAKYEIFLQFWLAKIISQKKIYNDLLNSFLEAEEIFPHFDKAVKELEPIIAKVVMFYLQEMDEKPSEKTFRILNSLYEIVQEYHLNIDSFYTRHWLEKFMEKGTRMFLNGDFSQVQYFNFLSKLYFLHQFRERENLYHTAVFNSIKKHREKIAQLSEDDKQALHEICINFKIDPGTLLEY